jgi:hypothetical protein
LLFFCLFSKNSGFYEAIKNKYKIKPETKPLGAIPFLLFSPDRNIVFYML